MQTLHLESSFQIALNWPYIRKMTMTSQFSNMTSSSNFFDFTGPSFMSISWLVLELWQFSFIRDWPEIHKSEIPQYEFCPISGDRGKLGILNLAWMFLTKCYWMLQNPRITTFTVSELLRENQQGGGDKINLSPPPPPRLGLMTSFHVFSKNYLNNLMKPLFQHLLYHCFLLVLLFSV